MWFAASSRQADSLLASRDCSRARSTLASSSLRLTGFSMKSEAPAFMAWTAIGTSLLPVIMMAGSRWPASLQPLQQFEPAHSRQVGIDQEAGFAAWMIGLEEGLAARIILHGPAIVLEHGADRLADVAVVVDDEDDRLAPDCWLRAAVCGSAGGRRGLRCLAEDVGSAASAPSTSPAC